LITFFRRLSNGTCGGEKEEVNEKVKERHRQANHKKSTQSESEPQDLALMKLSASVVAIFCAVSLGCSAQVAASMSSESSAISRIGCVPNVST